MRIGLGAMGLQMARHSKLIGAEVTAYDMFAEATARPPSTAQSAEPRLRIQAEAPTLSSHGAERDVGSDLSQPWLQVR